MFRHLHLKIGLFFTFFFLSNTVLHAQIDAWTNTPEICLGEQAEMNSVIELPVEEYNPVYFIHNDTVLDDVFDIGFDFKFYETVYKKFVIAPNGWISFNTTLAGTFDDWHATKLPSETAPKNAILFPWQDWYPYVDDGSYVGWAVLGYAPMRRLVVNFFNVKLAGNESSNERGTFQLKLFETSNTIEVHITKKPSSGSYLNNIATIGVNDEQGVRCFYPTVPDRNGTSWTTENEAWQFFRTGNPANAYAVVSIDFEPEIIGEIGPVKWYENTVDLDHYLSTGNTLFTTPTETTQYIAQILVNGTVPYSDTVEIKVNQIPEVDAGEDKTITSGETVTLNGTVTVGTPLFQYFWESADGSWSSEEQNPQVSPVNTSEYLFWVIDANGCISLKDNVIVEVMNSPLFMTVSADPLTVCKGDEVLLTAKIYGGYPPYQCSWEAKPQLTGWNPDNEPLQTVNPIETTTFLVTVTDDNSSTYTDSITVTVVTVQPELSGLQDFCELSQGIVFSTPPTGNLFSWDLTGDVPGELSSSNNELTVDFGEGYGLDTIIVIETTNDLYKCKASDSIVVTIHPNPGPVIMDQGGNPVCQYASGVIYSADFVAGHSYQWDMVRNYGTFVDADSTQHQIKIDWHSSGQELLVLTQTSDYGCVKTVTKDIIIHPAPTPVIMGPEAICEKDTSIHLTQSHSGHSYFWETIPPFPGDVLSDFTTNEIKVSWKQAGTALMTVTETIDDTQCTAESLPFTTTIHALPKLELLSESHSVCQGDSVLIELSGGDLYHWQPYQDMSWIDDSTWWASPGQTMNYIVIGEDILTGCFSNPLALEVEIRPNPIIDLGVDQYLSPGETITLDAGEGFDEYLWSTGDIGQTLSVNSAGLYEVRVGLKNCEAQDSIRIKMPAGLIPIPNAFTPNGDGSNDHFGLAGSLEEITRFNMQIFNRWGAKIYETTDPSQPWDGTYQGILCETGTYLWVISVEEKSLGQNITKRGYVSLLR
ncbi:MAG TPA: gliding motility-associated C-terminal domain-containing protein [Bacteroidales bacterium]|nr:gliding motility-associated C-terminal domain-containing protein [Bacteroidales bacterium]HNS46778.1 gliding motility-associated C-terminal domain-containing protein [Bacteroidales bacterium]